MLHPGWFQEAQPPLLVDSIGDCLLILALFCCYIVNKVTSSHWLPWTSAASPGSVYVTDFLALKYNVQLERRGRTR